MIAPRLVLAALLVALLASGCQLRVAADVDVSVDGTGTFELAVAIDDELEAVLRDAGIDPLAGAGSLDGADWQVEIDDDAGAAVRLRTAFAAPEDLARRVRSLQASLAPEDGSLLRDLRLAVAPDGSARIEGEAGLVLPAIAGAEGVGVAFDAADLAALLAERGDELVRYELRVTLPGRIASSDADVVDGRSATWRLPVGSERALLAVADPPPSIVTPALVATALLIAAGTALGVVMLRTSRRNRARYASRDTRALARLGGDDPPA